MHENFTTLPRRNGRRAVVVQPEFLRVCEFTSAFLFDGARGAERGNEARSLNLYRVAYIACSRPTELQIRSAVQLGRYLRVFRFFLAPPARTRATGKYSHKEDFRYWKSNDREFQRKKFSLLAEKVQPFCATAS